MLSANLLFSDMYRGRRLSDSLTVALKEIHDY